jgi:hypothetical protein
LNSKEITNITEITKEQLSFELPQTLKEAWKKWFCCLYEACVAKRGLPTFSSSASQLPTETHSPFC